jgi:hypothetical protein
MSSKGTAKASATGRTMKSVSGMEGAGIEFIRPSKLTGPATLINEGLYIGSSKNNFDEAKLDYKFEDETGKVVVLNGAGNLGYQMGKVPVNSIVTINYKGKQKITKGKLAGKESHNFDVLVAE